MSGGIHLRANIDAKAWREYLEHIRQPRLGQALSVAVNDTARQIEREAERRIARAVSIDRKRVQKGVYIKPFSTSETLTASVVASGSPIPLKAFKARETRAGVAARIWGERKVYPGAFIMGGLPKARVALNMGGHVFERAGKPRLPIRRLPGAAIAEGLTNEAIGGAIEKVADERLMANVLRQLDRYTRRSRGKVAG